MSFQLDSPGWRYLRNHCALKHEECDSQFILFSPPFFLGPIAVCFLTHPLIRVAFFAQFPPGCWPPILALVTTRVCRHLFVLPLWFFCSYVRSKASTWVCQNTFLVLLGVCQSSLIYIVLPRAVPFPECCRFRAPPFLLVQFVFYWHSQWDAPVSFRSPFDSFPELPISVFTHDQAFFFLKVLSPSRGLAPSF